MKHGIVRGICIAPVAKAPMQSRNQIMALAGYGLEGDRYASGNGSFNRNIVGKRQVTLINHRFFANSGFQFPECRRNLLVEGVELNWLSENREFIIGGAIFRGVKYCDPCGQPNKLSGNPKVFMEAFFDCGGIIAEVIQSGLIRLNDEIIPPNRGY